jgi:tripartite-type tricarboxylate transporter receptor subunit TctC
MMRVALFAVCLFLLCASKVPAQTPFYQGKQIKVIVGFTTGGFYDRWARLLSRYMPKHIPGSPESGENLEKLVTKTMNQPADVIARVKKLLDN